MLIFGVAAREGGGFGGGFFERDPRFGAFAWILRYRLFSLQRIFHHGTYLIVSSLFENATIDCRALFRLMGTCLLEVFFRFCLGPGLGPHSPAYSVPLRNAFRAWV